ncbi:hypothetical protein MBLNU230_g3877t1 [Neophaeotheca triangularis]
MRFYDLALSLALSTSALAASPEQWRSRSIYQVLTDRFARADGSTTADCNPGIGRFCGGSWRGIIRRLDYIQALGFDAVWISPVTKQIQTVTAYGDPYHGYWQQDIYSLNENFGTEQDLKDLSAELHARGMYLMVDVVTNHFGYNGSPSQVDYSVFNPWNEERYFHEYCSIDYTSELSTQICWEGDTTVSLPDIRTEDDDIRSTWQDWIRDLVNEYGIDGLRLDVAKQVRPDFWPPFNQAAGGLYMVGEIYDGSSQYVCGFQDVMPGAMNFPLYYTMFDAFASSSGSMSAFANMLNQVANDCADTSLMGQFTENHDRPRFAGATGDLPRARNVITATMLTDGIPIIYAGQEQHYDAPGGQNNDPYNREATWLSGYNSNAPLAQLVTALNDIRKWAFQDDGSSFYNDNARPIYQDNSAIAIRKGKMVMVLTNGGINAGSSTVTVSSNVGVSNGDEMTELLTCSTLTAGSGGSLRVPMRRGAPRIYYPTSSLSGSGLCNN